MKIKHIIMTVCLIASAGLAFWGDKAPQTDIVEATAQQPKTLKSKNSDDLLNSNQPSSATNPSQAASRKDGKEIMI